MIEPIEGRRGRPKFELKYILNEIVKGFLESGVVGQREANGTPTGFVHGYARPII